MHFHIYWLDIEPFLARREQPVCLLERPRAGNRESTRGEIFPASQVGRVGEFHVPTTPLNQDDIRWARTVEGEYVRVPVHAYQIEKPAKSLILAVGMELGMRCALGLAQRVAKMPEAFTLVVGKECHEVDGGYRCYVGLTARY